MSYKEIFEEEINKQKNIISSSIEKTLNKYDITNLTGQNLDSLGNIFGVNRISRNSDPVIKKAISISRKDKNKIVFLQIPNNSKFYLIYNVYLENKNKSINENTDVIYIDCILNTNIKGIIQPKPILSILSDNLELNLEIYNMNLIVTIEPQISNENDNEYRGRILGMIKMNPSSINRIKSVIEQLNITNYTILNDSINMGRTVIIISPPNYNKFDEYKILLENNLNISLGIGNFSVEIRKPDIIWIELNNYEKFDTDVEEYISKLALGNYPDIYKIRELTGSSSNIIFEDNVENTKTITISQKVQLIKN